MNNIQFLDYLVNFGKIEPDKVKDTLLIEMDNNGISLQKYYRYYSKLNCNDMIDVGLFVSTSIHIKESCDDIEYFMNEVIKIYDKYISYFKNEASIKIMKRIFYNNYISCILHRSSLCDKDTIIKLLKTTYSNEFVINDEHHIFKNKPRINLGVSGWKYPSTYAQAYVIYANEEAEILYDKLIESKDIEEADFLIIMY